MKTTTYVLGSLLALFVLLSVMGVIGITYPRVVPKEPLQKPVKISLSDSSILHLPDGRTFLLGQTEANKTWEEVFSESDYFVDIVETTHGDLSIYANQKGWICGTPWATAIRIPLIPQTVYRDRRQLVASLNPQDELKPNHSVEPTR